MPPVSDLPPGIFWPKDRSVRSSDGASLSYTFLGPDDGPVVALCSGFLCPDTWWWHLVPALENAGYRILLFHYRGIATSTLPHRTTPDAFSIPRNARDLLEIADAEGLDDLVLVGHSMGVQVMLEAFCLLRGRVRAIASLTGPYASPVRTLYGRREVSYLVYEPVRLALKMTLPPVLRLGWRAAWGHLPFLGIGRAVKAFGARTSDELVASYVAHARAMDPRIAIRMAEGMHAHSAADSLHEIDVPALVVVGGKDPFTPPDLGRHMADVMREAVLRVAPNGTHGTVLEYPELVNGWVLDFLESVAPADRRVVS